MSGSGSTCIKILSKNVIKNGCIVEEWWLSLGSVTSDLNCGLKLWFKLIWFKLNPPYILLLMSATLHKASCIIGRNTKH